MFILLVLFASIVSSHSVAPKLLTPSCSDLPNVIVAQLKRASDGQDLKRFITGFEQLEGFIPIEDVEAVERFDEALLVMDANAIKGLLTDNSVRKRLNEAVGENNRPPLARVLLNWLVGISYYPHRDRPEIVKLLLNAGADPHIILSNGVPLYLEFFRETNHYVGNPNQYKQILQIVDLLLPKLRSKAIEPEFWDQIIINDLSLFPFTALKLIAEGFSGIGEQQVVNLSYALKMTTRNYRNLSAIEKDDMIRTLLNLRKMSTKSTQFTTPAAATAFKKLQEDVLNFNL